jgi:hypothetical protein
MVEFEIAQFNVTHLLAPLDDPRLADFVGGLLEINALADAAPGFVWRLVDAEHDDSTSLRPLGPDVIVNLSVWRGIEDLSSYVYRSRHLDFLRRRREWFRPATGPQAVLWWVPAGHRPPVAEALERFALLAERGRGPDVFTLREPYPAPDVAVGTLSA